MAGMSSSRPRIDFGGVLFEPFENVVLDDFKAVVQEKDLLSKFKLVYGLDSTYLKWNVNKMGGCVMTYKKELSKWEKFTPDPKWRPPADKSNFDFYFDGWTMYVALNVKKEVGCNFHGFFFEKDSSFLCIRRLDYGGAKGKATDRHRLKLLSLSCPVAGSSADEPQFDPVINLLCLSNITEASQRITEAIKRFNEANDSASSAGAPDQAAGARPLEQGVTGSTFSVAVASAAARGGGTGSELISKRRRTSFTPGTALQMRPDGAGGDCSKKLLGSAIADVVLWMLSRE
jgi:hypothetical protein